MPAEGYTAEQIFDLLLINKAIIVANSDTLQSVVVLCGSNTRIGAAEIVKNSKGSRLTTYKKG